MSLTLPEWATRGGVELTAAQVTALASSEAVDVTPDNPEAGTWKLRARHHVGVFIVDGFEVRIHPKVGVHRLLALMCESIERVSWDETDTLWAETNDLLATIAGSFCSHSERALAQGLLQGYQAVGEALFGVKGRIDMSAQLSRRTGLGLPVEVMFDEYTVDITENRLLCGAARQLLRIPSLPATLQARLRRLAALLIDVTPSPTQPSPPTVSITRLNARYQPAITLARLILRSCSLEDHEERDIRGSGLLVDMNKLFEDVVGGGLREASSSTGITVQTQYPDHLDSEEQLKQITPDVVWLDHGKVSAVADVKYKQPASFGVDNGDIYQVLAYASRYGLADVHLIYAERPPFAALHVAATTVHLHHVDLELPLPERRHQLHQIARAIVVAA